MKKVLLGLIYFLLSFDIAYAAEIDYGNICGNSGVGSAMVILGYIIQVAKWVAPLIIIVLGMVDFGKAALSSDEKATTKASGALVRRFIAGIVIFFVPTIISAFTKNILKTNIENEFLSCTSCMFSPSICQEQVKLLKEQEKEQSIKDHEELEKEQEKYEDEIYTSSNSHTSSVNGIKYKLYNQSDPIWGNVKYPSGKTISDIGCMISAVAVLSSAHDANITPKTVFDSNYRHAWPHNGVNYLSENSFICTNKTSSINYDDVKSSLKSGNTMIIKVEDASPFTGSQHYMSLIDISSDGSEVFVGNSYGSGTGTYNRNGWFKIDTVLNDVHELYECMPKDKLINKFKKGSGNDLTSSSDITLNYDYRTDASLRYFLYTPSSAKPSSKTPLIVWLHGSGEKNASESVFKDRGLPKVLNNWKLDGFNAYVLCPIATGDWINNREQVYTLIEKIIKENNINTNKIILVGHSMGGIGVQTIANGNASYFSSLVILSGYNAGVDLNQFKGIPIKAYAGSTGTGEDSSSYSFTVNKFANVFGTDNMRILSTSHGNVPNMAFNLDENNDNKSDLIEWMLTQ